MAHLEFGETTSLKYNMSRHSLYKWIDQPVLKKMFVNTNTLDCEVNIKLLG